MSTPMTSQQSLSKNLVFSGVVHVGIILFFIIKSIVAPSKMVLITPTLRVDIVGLPDILKKDLSLVSKKQPTSPTEKTTKETEETKPDELILKPKKETKAREKKMNQALARIKALDKIANEPDTNDVVIKGNIISKGTSLSGDAKESSETTYYDGVREHLLDHWALPTWLARQRLSAQVWISIDSRGFISQSKFVKTSGNATFDDAIRLTLKEAQPLPIPPKNLTQTMQTQGIVIGFPL